MGASWLFFAWFEENLTRHIRPAVAVVSAATAWICLFAGEVLHSLRGKADPGAFQQVDMPWQLDLIDGAENENQRKIRRLLGDLPGLIKLIEIGNAHLRKINENNETGALQILSALDHVRHESEALLAELRAQEDMVAVIVAGNVLRPEQITEDGRRIAEVMERVLKLSDLTKIINHIARQTHLLALNASIEAARAGEAGRCFAVVADEVRKLSQQTEQAVTRINDEINNVSQLVNENLATISSRTRQAMGKVNEDILNALGYFQFQDVTRQQVEHVRHALEELDAYFSGVKKALDAEEAEGWPELSARIDALRDGYVMSSQRVTHDAVLGKHTQEESCPAIELF